MSEHSTRLRELSCSSYARKVCDEAADEIERLRDRIEELEKESEWKAMKQLLCADYHIITTDQIREAWGFSNYSDRRVYREVLVNLGIVRCEGCGGSGVTSPTHELDAEDCVDCHGEGFKIGGGDG